MFFCPQKVKKKHLKKLHTYDNWEVFFSAAPTAQNSPELHFRFINSFIQLSLLRSLIRTKGGFSVGLLQDSFIAAQNFATLVSIYISYENRSI